MKAYLTPRVQITVMTSCDIITSSPQKIEAAFDNQLDVWDMNISIE